MYSGPGPGEAKQLNPQVVDPVAYAIRETIFAVARLPLCSVIVPLLSLLVGLLEAIPPQFVPI